MFTGKRILVAWAALMLAGLPVFAADGYYASKPRKVAVWRGDMAPAPPIPPRLAQNDQRLISPLPEDDDDDSSSPAEHNHMGNDNSGPSYDDPWEGGCGEQSCRCLPFWAHRNYIFGSFLYLRPTGDNVAYAILQNGVGGPGTTPNGRVGVVDSNYTEAFRTGFAKSLGYCASIEVGYSNFHSHATDQITADQGIGNTIASLVLHPNSVNAGSTSSLVDASHDIDFQVVDVAYRRLLVGGFRHALNYNVGVRYGNLRQDFQQLGNFTPPVGTILTNTTIKFEGAGLRTGLDYERQIGCRGLSAYGKGFINVLFGQFNSSFTQLDTTSTIVQATSNWRDERVVPVLEYELGINWTSCNGHWRVSSGYYTAFWFNAVTTSQYIQAVQNANFVNLGQTVVFDGYVSRLEFRF